MHSPLFLHPPLFITGEGYRQPNTLVLDDIRAALEGEASSLQTAIAQNAPLVPDLLESAVRILCLALGPLATPRNAKAVSRHLDRSIHFGITYDCAVDRAGIADTSAHVARLLGDLLQQAATILRCPPLEAVVPQIRLALFSLIQPWMVVDPYLRPWQAAELMLRLENGLARQNPDKVVDVLQELYASIADDLRGQADLGLSLAIDPFVAVLNRGILFIDIDKTRIDHLPPDSVPDVEVVASLNERQRRLQAAPGDRAIELAWVAFVIDAVKSRIARKRSRPDLGSAATVPVVPAAESGSPQDGASHHPDGICQS